MKTIISILSRELIPSILFIKQMAKPEDFHVFLSTLEMENKEKSKTLSETVGLAKDRYKTILIDQNSPTKILKQLESTFPIDEHAYIVNITGGTKMMSQMCFLHFFNFNNAKIYYWPIGKNYLEQLHPEFERAEIKKPISLNLNSYFKAHGYYFTNENRLSQNIRRTEQLMQEVVKHNDSSKVSKIVTAQQMEYRKNDKSYLTGGWFEEWIYNTTREALDLKSNQIGLNLKIKNRSSKNDSPNDYEIDVAFVYNNTLYIIECKVFTTKQATTKKIEDTIHKIASIRYSLGIKAVAIAAILSPIGTNKKRILTIEDTLNITGVKKVLFLENFKAKSQFINELKKIVNYE